MSVFLLPAKQTTDQLEAGVHSGTGEACDARGPRRPGAKAGDRCAGPHKLLGKGNALTSPQEEKRHAPRTQASAAWLQRTQSQPYPPASRSQPVTALAPLPAPGTAQAHRTLGLGRASLPVHVTTPPRDPHRCDLFRSLGSGTSRSLLPPSARFLIPLLSLPPPAPCCPRLPPRKISVSSSRPLFVPSAGNK